MATTQISAYISEDTKCLVEAYTKRTGIKKGFLIEDALLHHLLALKEIPQDIIIPGNITITEQSMNQLSDLLDKPPQPTSELQKLMQND